MRNPTEKLRELLAAHGVRLTPHADGCLTTNGKYPVCRAHLFGPNIGQDGCSVQLNVEIGLSPDRLLVETFGGSAETSDEAANSSFANFALSSLHVLLCAVWLQSNNHQQIAIENWVIGGRRWRLFLGNIVRMSFDEIGVAPAADLIERLQQLIVATEFTPATHWGRMYYANVSREQAVVEVLLDNEPWRAGEETVRACNWEKKDSFYSSRLFWMLEPIPE